MKAAHVLPMYYLTVGSIFFEAFLFGSLYIQEKIFLKIEKIILSFF